MHLTNQPQPTNQPNKNMKLKIYLNKRWDDKCETVFWTYDKNAAEAMRSLYQKKDRSVKYFVSYYRYYKED